MLVIAAFVAAEWVTVPGGLGYDTYVDSASMGRDGALVRMWHLWDFKVHRYTASQKRFRSLKAHGEYDCTEKRVRVLSSAFYEGNKAEGASVLEEAKAGDWIAIKPDSVWQPLWDYACKSS